MGKSPYLSNRSVYGVLILDFLYEFGLFLVKSITIVVAIAAVLIVFVSIAAKQNPKEGEGSLSLSSLSDGFDEISEIGRATLLDKKALKELDKQKKQEKKSKKEEKSKPNLFVLEFNGSPTAKEVETLRKEITAILCIAKPEQDEVLVKVESGGGVVHGYGLAASQLQRIKDKNIKLHVSVDKVAASGGYMMACVADNVLAAPFAIVGSIGVVAQLPNFNKVLKKNDIDLELHTAGEFKRTLTVFGENTDEGRDKFKSELEDVHVLFKEFVILNRPVLNIDEVATGEYWYGIRALENKLIDKIQTSDDFLMDANETFKLYKIKYTSKKTMAQKFGLAASQTLENAITKVLANVRNWYL